MQEYVKMYLEFCEYEKQLSSYTIRTYRYDLSVYSQFLSENGLTEDVRLMDRELVRDYVRHMHEIYKPTSVEKKLTSIKAFFNFLEFEEIIPETPFKRLRVNAKPPKRLPEYLTMKELKMILESVYDNDDLKRDKTTRTYIEAVRNIAMIELFISTGIRVNEMINILRKDLDLDDRNLLIRGKGRKERLIYISNDGTIISLKNYLKLIGELPMDEYLFTGRRGQSMKDDCIRMMIKKHAKGIEKNVTPHIFRHAFATLLMDDGVHITQIQRLLGHHSTNVTQIYTHVSMAQTESILKKHNPRNQLKTPEMYFDEKLINYCRERKRLERTN